MKKSILSAIFLGCLILQSSMGIVSVYAAEDETEPAMADETEEAETEYINGMPVDYDDPDCLKYLERQESDTTADASVPQILSSGYTTTWGGKTYAHKASVAEDKTILPGIDVSKWEGNIDWNKVANSGIEFAFIRIGYTGASTGGHNLDPYYTTNMKNAIAAGIKVGIYYYSQAITVAEAESEAQYVLNNLGGYQPDLPIIIDYEYFDGGRMTSSTPNKATKTSIVNAFCKKIEAKGYTAGLYADKDMLTNSLNTSEIDNNYEIWMAQWRTSESDYARSYQYWQCSDNASVDGISKKTDLDWGYFSGTTGKDIVKKSSGEWVYQVDGVDDYTYTGVAKNKNGWWYVENGIVDFSYNGFAQNENGWWYIENGKVTFNKNSVIKDTGKKIDGTASWWYVVGSKVQKSFTGLADYKNSNGWWYISKGKVTFDVNTVAKNKNGWWYVKDSKVDFSYNGFEQNSNGWWYLEDGKVTFNKNSVIKDTNKKIDGEKSWWYVVGSKVQKSFTGLANYRNSNGWWYIRNGKVDFSVNTVAKNKNGWWYVLGGKVQFGFTGLADYKNANGWWYINKGKVTFNVNTVAKNKNGWWYVKNSKVNFGYNGIAQNKNGWWYIKNGKVDFSYNGKVTVSGKTYSVHNGEVAK